MIRLFGFACGGAAKTEKQSDKPRAAWVEDLAQSRGGVVVAVELGRRGRHDDSARWRRGVEDRADYYQQLVSADAEV